MFNQKKRYFKGKLKGVKRLIWDLEFKRAKTQMIREEIRQEYDNDKSKLAILEERIKKQKDKKLDDEKVLLERDIKNFEKQMDGLDIEIKGSRKTVDFPDGIQGVNQQIDALRELQEMLKEYINNL